MVLNEDGSLNSQTHPAAKGKQAAFFVTGLGQTDPPEIDGSIPNLHFRRSRGGA
jgi:uncharacterized protein (TIGR03437 family)